MRIQPVEFEAGSARVEPALERQLQRVADFLRASPFVGLELTPVVAEVDVERLRIEAVRARIQQVQRDHDLGSFLAAAMALHAERFQAGDWPGGMEEIVTEVAEREPRPEQAARDLAAQRVAAVRGTLIERAGIDPGRLTSVGVAPEAAVARPGRVEFAPRPPTGPRPS